MYNILVIGKSGQLANALRDVYTKNNFDFNLFFVGKDDFDILDEQSVYETFKSFGVKINYCIDCAAYTQVDKAELDYDTAININEIGTKNIKNVCAKFNCKLLYISTDYVYDGHNYKPYTAADEPNPLSVYGTTKLAGENIVLSYSNSLVIRTSWLYYDNGKNFPNTMLNMMKDHEFIKVVNDQIGSPTYAKDLAEAIFTIIFSGNWSNDTGKCIYQFSNEGAISWYDFCCAIKFLTNSKCKIIPISSLDYVTAAKRPYYSVLDSSSLYRDFNIIPKWWFDSLQVFISNYNK